jgi:hypothetical protein
MQHPGRRCSGQPDGRTRLAPGKLSYLGDWCCTCLLACRRAAAVTVVVSRTIVYFVLVPRQQRALLGRTLRDVMWTIRDGD